MTAQYDYTIQYRLWHDESKAAATAAYLRALLEPHLPVPQGKSLLDIGCGMGFALRAMREYGFQDVRGIDVSPEQIEACRRIGEPGELVTDTCAYLSTVQSEFDVVLLLDVLEHVPRDSQIHLARSIFAALKPGGCAIVQVPNATSPLAMRWLYDDFTHYSSFTQHSLQFVLRNAGFSRIEIPTQGPLKRPPLRFWRRAFWPALRHWAVRLAWRQVLIAELGSDVNNLCVELNLFCVAYKGQAANN